MYGVVVCSSCRRPKAADLRGKTTRCQCGSKIDLRTAVVRYRDPSALKVAEAVRAMTVESQGAIGGGLRGGGEESAVEAAAEAASSVSGRWLKACKVAETLTERGRSFTEEEFVAALEMLDVNNPREMLMGLLARNLLMRVEKDAYAFL
jgi:DNA-directed RNA polymerase subunit RPC12/RpoP